jgi:hypothetical protein
MTDRPPTDRRAVRSADPSLSAEANRLLTLELREIAGRDVVDVPVGRLDPARTVHGVHGPVVADVLGAQLGPGDPDRLLEDLVEEFREPDRR